ncbi:sensor histidine kinase [Alkalicoccobacillus murimartini]|uniref:Two-component system sensor histidine kinase YesM n=1 Tax=Alkalicoccobacillus murimartini TaxID=171685 RepID=A0ABT9YDB4_9BACI|nr:histidine kinase [Alkalicoccobacillus murimartini]MDQ0205721.1 two-component system sensor histidine kinase YesM [Alkalicoccobacillus murimartini]
MRNKLTLFKKAVIVLLILLIPTLILYSYSNYVTEQVIKEEIHSRNVNRLEVSANRLDADLEQISQFLMALSIDSDISSLRNIDLYSPYDAVVLKEKVSNKLLTYQQLSRLLVDVSIYMPNNESVITTMATFPGQPNDLSESWSYISDVENSREIWTNEYFLRHVRYPTNNQQIGNEVVIEARVYVDSIRKHLAELESADLNDAFLIHNQFGRITSRNHTYKPENSNMKEEMKGDSGTLQLTYNGKQHLVSYVQSEALGWTLVDYVPLEEVLSPVYKSRHLLYGSVALMVLLGFISGWLLYKNIHIPIRQLKDGIKRIKRSDYSVRMEIGIQNEFSSLMSGFNEMTVQIQTLIEQVYEEKIRSQEASLKLLQAQINPHFLYNCLFYIKNMAKVQQTDAVEAMALHLGQYFRYRTKVEEENTHLSEEMDLISTFLAIHSLRKRSLTYSISIPKQMEDLIIPRLLIQPIVENAVVHAIEKLEGNGHITITGGILKNGYFVAVDDNGKGLMDHERKVLKNELELDEMLEGSYGMRNVHHRLKGRYGGTSGLSIEESKLGGLRVELIWETGKSD